ncbi:hypothetical protein F4777DRAFT_412842 [Nemania sp. FL0916]|nr:hypothetical protein F4777DRAFT_412842 [Nemania sp. FL0916]
MYQIILEAIKLHGIQRAGRLRYVSVQTPWNTTALDAICMSGVPEFWVLGPGGGILGGWKVPRYAAKRIMSCSQMLLPKSFLIALIIVYLLGTSIVHSSRSTHLCWLYKSITRGRLAVSRAVKGWEPWGCRIMRRFRSSTAHNHR